MAQVTCSFCGRNKKDVDLMISGINAHICDKCITQAQQILSEELKTKSSGSSTPNFNLIKPVELKKYLDQYVVGHRCSVDEAGFAGVEVVDDVHHVPGVRFPDSGDRLLGDEFGEGVGGALFV